MSLPRWLFVDLNSFFASCEQQEHPHLRGKPVGVLATLVDSTCCLAASYEAKAFGVKTGTGVRDARARCPQIRFVEARHEVYARYHHKIVAAVDRVLPVDSILSIDEMICELTGSQRDLNAAIALAQKIKESLREHVGECLTASIGIAPNRYLAKVASDMQKPNGLTIIHREDLPAALYRLALCDFPGIGPRMERRLNAHGIYTTYELLHLSTSEMRALWGGVVGDRFAQYLQGFDVATPPTHHGSLGHQHVLEPELRTREGSWLVMKKLLLKAAVRLRKEGNFVKRLSAHVHFLGGMGWDQSIKFEETQDTLKLMTALRRIWLRDMQGQKPLRVGVTLWDLVPGSRHQLSLFENPFRENLGSAMDKINTRYGKDTVSVGGLLQIRHSAPTRISFNRIPDLSEF